MFHTYSAGQVAQPFYSTKRLLGSYKATFQRCSPESSLAFAHLRNVHPLLFKGQGMNVSLGNKTLKRGTMISKLYQTLTLERPRERNRKNRKAPMPSTRATVSAT